MSPAEKIVRRLLEAEDDFDPKDFLNLPPPDPGTLQKVIRRKESYLNRSCVKTFIHTNPQGETFLFGKFGTRGSTISTLMFFNPSTGWESDDKNDDSTRWVVAESTEDDPVDPRELMGGPRDDVGRKYLPLGTISHGTMVPKHLARNWLRAIRRIDPITADSLQSQYDQLNEDDITEFVYENIFDTLQDYCAPYTSFGAHEGDGSDYGIWIDHDLLLNDEDEEGIRSDGLIQLKVVPQGTLPENIPATGYRFIATKDERDDFRGLYDAETGHEYWSV